MVKRKQNKNYILIFFILCSTVFAGDIILLNDGDLISWPNNSQTVRVYAHPSASESYEQIFPSAKGTGGQALIIDSVVGDVITHAYSSPSSFAAHQMLSPTHTDATTANIIQGDILYGFANNDLRRLPVGTALGGTATTFFGGDGTDVGYRTVAQVVTDLNTPLDLEYLRLDTTNDPLTGDLDFGGNDILSSGALGFKVSGNTSNYISFSTIFSVPTINSVGTSNFINIVMASGTPGIRLVEDSSNRMTLRWDGTDTSFVESTHNITIQSRGNNGDINLTPNGTGVVNVSSDLNMGFFDIINPDNMDGSVEPAAITDIDAAPHAHWSFQDAANKTTLAAAEGGATFSLTAGTTNFCDRGVKKGIEYPGDSYHEATGYKGITGTGDWSLSFMIKPELDEEFNSFLYWGTSASVGRNVQLQVNNDNRIRMFFGNGFLNGATPLVPNEWSHVLFVHPSGANYTEMVIYLNGVEDTGTNSGTNSVDILSGDDFRLGQVPAGGFMFTGCLDEVALFDSELTSANARNIFDRQQDREIRGTSNSQIDWTKADSNFSTTGNLDVGGDGDITGSLDVGITLDVAGAAFVRGSFDVGTNNFTVSAAGVTNVFGKLTAFADLAVVGITDLGDGGDTLFMRIEADGDTFWVGAGTGLPYACMYVDGTQAIEVALTSGVVAEVKDDGTTSLDDGWLAGDLNLITFPTGGDEHYLSVTKAGFYRIQWSLSFNTANPGANVEIHGGIAVDGTAIRNKAEAHRTIANNSDTGNMGGTAMIDAPNGTEQISLWLLNTTNNADVTVEHGNVSMAMAGGT
ncbi:hypothetical protein LCGC14_0362150 [marine sediment metagenome]|uniref:LamG-like jellyroll fold domain-containing protein n=1 Tax=marine sediment metagenome TaxID=412755 RepID=A0A0F9TQK2_9ZZZZ